ncbi:MAG: FtsX-like permease family protein [bacterium]
MEFSEIAFKMFKTEIKKYRLFILCNLLVVAILYSFISILSNKQFMNASIVDPMISSNVFGPTYLIIAFSIIFIPYTQNVFIKSRQRDYGILLTLGMTENEVRRSVLIENLILCLLFLIFGLLLGTVLSLVFLGFIHYIIGVEGINATISVTSYKVTSVYILILFIISLILNFIGMIKSTVYEKIKYTAKAESGKHHSIKLFLLGVLITIAAFIIMVYYYHMDSNVWFLSVLVSVLGSILIFFNGEALIEYFKSKHYKKYIKNLFLFSDIKYYYGKNKKIFFATSWIFFVALFFIMISLVMYPGLINNSIVYHPFHMVYGETEGGFEPLGNDEIKTIADNNNNHITFNDTIKTVRINGFSVFSVENINRVLNKDYTISENAVIYVYPYHKNDGYGQNTDLNISDINFSSEKDTREFIVDDKIVDPLFGRVNFISDRIILVNKGDYDWFALNSRGRKLHLYNFENWRTSEPIVHEVWDRLLKNNNIINERDKGFYKVSSRIVGYETALKSSNLLIVFHLYVCLLLYFSAIIMIHFKLKMEFRDDKKKFYGLYRIGIRKSEVIKIISQKIFGVYFLPFVYAAILNIAYAYYITSSYGEGRIGILTAILTTVVFLLIHIIVFKLYSKKYFKNLFEDIANKP